MKKHYNDNRKRLINLFVFTLIVIITVISGNVSSYYVTHQSNQILDFWVPFEVWMVNPPEEELGENPVPTMTINGTFIFVAEAEKVCSLSLFIYSYGFIGSGITNHLEVAFNTNQLADIDVPYRIRAIGWSIDPFVPGNGFSEWVRFYVDNE